MNSNTAQQKSIYTDILNHKIQSYPPLSLTHRYLVHLSSLTLSFKEMQWFITNIFHRYHYITLFLKEGLKSFWSIHHDIERFFSEALATQIHTRHIIKHCFCFKHLITFKKKKVSKKDSRCVFMKVNRAKEHKLAISKNIVKILKMYCFMSQVNVSVFPVDQKILKDKSCIKVLKRYLFYITYWKARVKHSAFFQ